MSMITVTIDGQEYQTQEGEYILNVARANGIFIPAICYITDCSPTLACRICLVEVNGKQAYACNAKAKDGMEIHVSTENIEEERRAIMEVYDVNHPLECGVCDQSGECELQNYTLEVGVDAQNYSIKDTHKPVEHWGLINYDPALCIMCERCTTVCKDMIGDSALGTKKRGSDALDASFKESMPKDAYAMWNKLNKSLIAPTTGDTLDCTDCGECTSVCPVGALVSSDFQYTSNAWELTQVPATCAHCSAGCQLMYDVKHTSIENSENKIYRVKNEWNYVSLCGAGRYGYDYENRVEKKYEDRFNVALYALKEANAIRFTSTITNEEALMLQTLKEARGLKLFNEEARYLQQFLHAYSKTSGTSLYGGDLNQVKASDFVISVGGSLKSDNPNARFAMNNAIIMNKGAGLYFHPIADPVIDTMSKNLLSINHAPLQEEAVLYLILDLFADKAALSEDVKTYLESFHSTQKETIEETVKEKVTEMVKEMQTDEESGEEREVEVEKTKTVSKKVSKEIDVDVNALLDMVNAPKDFMASLEKLLKKKERFSLIVGADLFSHPEYENCASLVALIEKVANFNVVLVPLHSNSLGVAQICTLDSDDNAIDQVVGYNAPGAFKIGAAGDVELNMPAMNQQEGTITSINKQVNPTNAALAYHGYELNDVVNALLGKEVALTIDYTKALPIEGGFNGEAFDELPNYYGNDGVEHRGYKLTNGSVSVEQRTMQPIHTDDSFDATLYQANPVLQFNAFTAASHQLAQKASFSVSEALAEKLSLTEGDRLKVTANNQEVISEITIDNKIGGEYLFVPTYDNSNGFDALFEAYRFQSAKIEKV